MPEFTHWKGSAARGYRPAVTMRWGADEVAILHRAYREHYGPHDGATEDVSKAVAAGVAYEEDLDPVDAYTAAGALEDAGLPREAECLRWMVGGMEPPSR